MKATNSITERLVRGDQFVEPSGFPVRIKFLMGQIKPLFIFDNSFNRYHNFYIKLFVKTNTVKYPASGFQLMTS